MAVISPVERECSACQGVGRPKADPWVTCGKCKGNGREWRPGAPGYGCKITLADRRVGEIVELGNGDRGRIVRHDLRTPETTSIALIGDFDGVESRHPISYPSSVGVVSVSDPRWFSADDHNKDNQDAGDPLQRHRKARR